MKKWIVVVVAIIIIALVAGPFLFIPGTLAISRVTPAKTSFDGAYRFLSKDDNRLRWWPADAGSKGYTFKTTRLLSNGIEVTISGNGLDLPSQFVLLPISADSVIIQWSCSLPASNNPLTRISRYQQAVKIKKAMVTIVDSLRSFVEEEKNIYGVNIRRGTATDTLLIATRDTFPASPTTAEIYNSIHLLEEYARKNGALTTGYPIMNISNISGKFQLMIAVPVDKVLPGDGAIYLTRMIRGAFMITETTGDAARVQAASDQLLLYFSDYGKTSMGVPFEALITNRQTEPDSTKWVTRIYAPVY